MRLVELRLVNFKSCRDATIRFEPFTCLIGPNNSGKTNVLEALAFLQQAFERELNEVARAHGGWSKVRHYATRPDEDVVISLLVETHGERERRLRYTVSITSDGFLREERLADEVRFGLPWLLRTSSEDSGVSRIVFFSDDGTERSVSSQSRLDRLQLPRRAEHSLASAVVQFVNGWRLYRFSPDRLKATGQATETRELARDGSNFASYVHSLQSRHRRAFHRIESQLIKSFPDVEELASPLIGTQTVVSVKEKWFDAHAEGAQLSDGLVGYLAHLVAFNAPHTPTLLVFEEPENYVHARLMERLVDMMKGASETTQTVITTHSVTLLNLLTLKDIRLVTREEGSTRVTSFEQNEALKEALKSYALGDAYFSGELGGVPE